MGQAQCKKPLNTNDVQEIQSPTKFRIGKPPSLHKPEKVLQPTFHDNITIVRERTIEGKKVDKESDDIHQNPQEANKCWIKKDDIPIQEEHLQEITSDVEIKHQMLQAAKKYTSEVNASQESQYQDFSASQRGIKSILKQKMQSGPTSPKNFVKQQSVDSSRSIKKVTFDKKQIIYSSFRK